jgi:O-antigen/teichoic acid export membrane protein
LLGDGIVFGGSVLLAKHPYVLFAIVAVAVALSALLVRWIWQRMKRLFRPRLSTLSEG